MVARISLWLVATAESADDRGSNVDDDDDDDDDDVGGDKDDDDGYDD